MIVECSIKGLLKLIGKKLSLKQLEDTLFLMKAEVENVVGDEIEIEINPDRQDMLSAEGIARAVRAFIGIKPGLRDFKVRKSGKQIIVGKGLTRIREFISCSIVRDVEVSDDLLKDYMHLQESLTATHGRNRKKASIGLYVLDDMKFPVKYYPERPEKIKFVPLGSDFEMDGPTILQEHEKGIIYGPIIAGFKKWPMLKDETGEVLSLPPIINSNTLGRLTEETNNIFIEVTGTHRPTVDQALNIMTTSLAERGGRIESLTVVYPNGTQQETPDLRPKRMTIKIEQFEKITGIKQSHEEIVTSLAKMGYDSKVSARGIVTVSYPTYRTDILHPVDIIEDAAIGYGFDKIVPTMPITMTTGQLLPITRLKNKVRDLMVGLEFQEVLSYIMSSPDVMNGKMMKNEHLVTARNPRSRDYSVLRNSLLPVLLDFTSKNQHADYPHRLFEIGDVVIPDDDYETMTNQKPTRCGLISDIKVNITELMTGIAFILRNLGLENRFEFSRIENPSFINGRSAIILIDGQPSGYFGETSPEVLTSFEITKPVVAFEMFLPRGGTW
ncbi:MAG: phenylalanine--tRNA ligase subunit beta [Candidatus Thorarchaeota archaeon]|jgi:phenylalanyl-tRNA synthetase beta chain